MTLAEYTDYLARRKYGPFGPIGALDACNVDPLARPTLRSSLGRGATARPARPIGEPWQVCSCCGVGVFCHDPTRVLVEVRCPKCEAQVEWLASLGRQNLRVVWTP